MGDKLQVNGIAIQAGMSRNNIRYDAEELQKFAKTMEGVSIIKDHNAICDNAVGVVEKTSFDTTTNSVLYNGWIVDDGVGIQEKVRDGRISKVSIGAMCGQLVKETEDSTFLIAKDMTGVELSMVIVPGIAGATISQSLESIEQHNVDNKIKIIPIVETWSAPHKNHITHETRVLSHASSLSESLGILSNHTTNVIGEVHNDP